MRKHFQYEWYNGWTNSYGPNTHIFFEDWDLLGIRVAQAFDEDPWEWFVDWDYRIYMEKKAV